MAGLHWSLPKCATREPVAPATPPADPTNARLNLNEDYIELDLTLDVAPVANKENRSPNIGGLIVPDVNTAEKAVSTVVQPPQIMPGKGNSAPPKTPLPTEIKQWAGNAASLRVCGSGKCASVMDTDQVASLPQRILCPVHQKDEHRLVIKPVPIDVGFLACQALRVETVLGERTKRRCPWAFQPGRGFRDLFCSESCRKAYGFNCRAQPI